MPKKRKKVTKKKFSWKLLLSFIIFEFVFTGVTAPLLVFHGPFENVKRTIVGAAMTTLSHQYIARMFLSDAEINKILSSNKVEAAVQDNNSTEVDLNSKHDDSIERYDVKSTKYKGYVLIINDATRVKVGYSAKLGTEGQMTSQIAKENGAIAAVNGGGFTDKADGSANWTGTGGTPIGIIMSNGNIKYNDVKDDNKKIDVLALTAKGLLLVGPHSMNEMKSKGVTDIISFGPALVVNGRGTIKSGDGGWGIAPRTAVGQRKDGAIILLVIDGRQASSLGASLKDVQDIMLQYAAVNATNLDGGSSSTMYYDGELINNPCDPLGERSVPSVIYVK
ncbi:MAG: exopolysaccharide biosynthesis protein [Clostridiaceae bacterium]|nr:exopolysaccharide biosynthesis protein [Clostridiaceae bacterium]